jgi:outer membrane receptor protein involved in Fe transport
VSLDVTYALGRVSAFATLGGRSQTLDLEPNYGAFGGLFDSPGYAVADVGGALALWSSRLEIFGRVNNVTNRQYEETLGYPALGRAGLIGVRVAAGRW